MKFRIFGVTSGSSLRYQVISEQDSRLQRATSPRIPVDEIGRRLSGMGSGASPRPEAKEKPIVLESLSSDELQFIKAIEKYKAENNKTFLSWTEVLKILKGLGYRRSEKNRTPAKKAEGVPAE